ncbi:MAG: cellulase family glycosylhydrolase [Clostridiales bacterium]|nr:cellulase family glycosylhydrolase [Clostridiales bacterium]
MNGFFKRALGLFLSAVIALSGLNCLAYGADVIQGDVDGSGELTANDAAVLLQYVIDPSGSNSEWQLDPYVTNVSTGDSEAAPTAADAALILKRVLDASADFAAYNGESGGESGGGDDEGDEGGETDVPTGTEKSILQSSGNNLISTSSSHVTTSEYSGYIETYYSSALTFDYFKVVYTVSGSADDSVQAFTLQPFDTSWGGWENNFVTIADSIYDETAGTYTAYVNADDVKASLSTGKSLNGINISFVQAEPEITLVDVIGLTLESSGDDDEGDTFEAYVKTIITEEDLNSAGVAWSGSTKATIYVKITEGGSYSQLNASAALAPDGAGKSSSKYLVGSAVTTGKTGNAIQDNLVGNAGTGCYAFPDVQFNKSMQDGSVWDDDYVNYVTIKIRIDTADTDYEFLGIKFSNGAVYPKDFTVPTVESSSYDSEEEEEETDGRELLKLTLDYAAGMDSSKYQAASWETFETSLASAQAVYDDDASTSSECKTARASLEKTKASMLFNDTTTAKSPSVFRTLDGDTTVDEMAAGINLGNTLDGHIYLTPSETAWQEVVTTKEYFKTLHDAGFNTVRIPVTWGTMIDDENGYAIDEEWIARVKEIVDYAVSQDMYAIINIHHDGADLDGWLNVSLDDIDPVYEKFECVWRNIAEYFKDYDEHLIFESMNEISCMTGDNKNSDAAIEYDTPIIVNLNQIFVNVVRSTGSNNTNRWLAVVSHYANGGTQSGFSLPTDSYNSSNRLMFAMHSYKHTSNTTWTYSEVYELVSAVSKAYNAHKIPMILGEYGTRTYVQSGTDTGYNDVARAYYSEIVHKAMQALHCVPVVWDQSYNDGDPYQTGIYNFYDRKTCTPLFKTIIDGMIRGTYLENTTGTNQSSVVEYPEIVPITELTLSDESLSLVLNDSYTVTATYSPSTTNDVVLWSTDDDSVVTVSRGKLRARGVGTATVTAFTQNGECVKTVTVTVTE